MIPYFILIIVPFLFCFVSTKEKEGKKCLVVNQTINSNDSLAIPVYFILLFLLLALKDESVGRDTESYRYFFEEYQKLDFSTAFHIDFEFLFPIFNKICSLISKNFQIYEAIIALIIVIPYYLLYKDNRENSFLKIILFSSMTSFIFMFSAIRQSIAVSISIIAYFCVRKKKLFPTILLGILALGFHHTGFMIFFMYPVYHIKIKRKYFFAIVPICLLVYFFNDRIFNFATGILAGFIDKYDMQASSNGAIGSLILFALFIIFVFVISDENRITSEMNGLRNLLLFATILQCFAPVNLWAMRMNIYYIIYIPLAISAFISYPNPKYWQVAKIGSIVLSVFFTCYFFYGIVSQYIANYSTLDTIPYYFFWES